MIAQPEQETKLGMAVGLARALNATMTLQMQDAVSLAQYHLVSLKPRIQRVEPEFSSNVLATCGSFVKVE